MRNFHLLTLLGGISLTITCVISVSVIIVGETVPLLTYNATCSDSTQCESNTECLSKDNIEFVCRCWDDDKWNPVQRWCTLSTKSTAYSVLESTLWIHTFDSSAGDPEESCLNTVACPPNEMCFSITSTDWACVCVDNYVRNNFTMKCVENQLCNNGVCVPE